MSVVDNIFSGLSSSGGSTINERVKNFLISEGLGTSSSSISDMLNKYTFDGKIGWQALIAKYGLGAVDELEALISTLFGNGEQGAFYVPQPQVLGQQVLYQDAAGTVPVTADGDPVGLMLDVSQGLELGPELVAMSTDPVDYHLFNTTASESGGALEVTKTGSNGYVVLQNPITVEPGKTYEIVIGAENVSFDIEPSRFRAFAARSATGGNAEAVSAELSADKLRLVYTPGVSTNYVAIQHLGGGSLGDVFTVSNISVRELPGNHASQSTSASRPIYRTDGTLHWLEADGVDDCLSVPGSASAFKFLHDGSGATVSLSVKPSQDDVDERLGIFLGSYRYSASYVGTAIGIDSRGGKDGNFRFGIGSGGPVVIDRNDTGLLSPANQNRVVTVQHGSARSLNARWLIDGTEEGSEDYSSAPSSSNSAGDLDLFNAFGGNFYQKGNIYGVLIVDNADVDLAAAESYLAELAGVTL